MNIPKLSNIVMGAKGMAITGGAAFLVGSIGGGWVVNKIWWGKAQAEKLATAEASLKATELTLDATKRSAISAAERAQDEAQARSETEQRLSRAYDDNARLAASRASTRTEIIQTGDKIGQELKTDYPCIYEPWPDRLRSFAFDTDTAEGLRGSAGGGYPQGDEGFIP